MGLSPSLSQALAVLGFGVGFYSLLSADDDLKGAIPIERWSASALVTASFITSIVTCAGATSLVTNSNILLFVYFVKSELVFALTLGTGVAVYASLPFVPRMLEDWCAVHPAQGVCQPDQREQALLEIKDHLASVGQASLVMAVMLVVNLVATFVMMQQVHKPTLYGWTHPSHGIFG